MSGRAFVGWGKMTPRVQSLFVAITVLTSFQPSSARATGIVTSDLGTPLMLESESGSLEATDTLLANGANVNATTSHGITALMLASQYGRREIVQALIAHQSDLNAQTSIGSTALMFAA